MAKTLPKFFDCAPEFTLAVLGGKWKTVILAILEQRPCRYTELRQLAPKLSDKMLSERLSDLMAMGLVMRSRQPAAGGGQAYMLTQKGRLMSGLLRTLCLWGEQNAMSFGVRLGEPLKALDSAKSKP
jgi:DNA-binding HxlR family transcriptional regulator